VEEVLALDVALERLARESERAVRVIECRIFAGLTLEETGRALGLSERSVRRTWSAATAWLRKEIGGDPPEER
jgi:RNA polymerase sigma factor (sigma-70 family)